MTGDPAERFRFRFLTRGEQSTRLLRLALLSLARCHPAMSVVVVDANDTPTIDTDLFDAAVNGVVVHLPPGEDAVEKAVGRGSRQHLFYWRYSPQARSALPPFDGFDVLADVDLVFLRPLDFCSLIGPLTYGRIAAAVDESTLDHYAAVGRAIGGMRTSALPLTGPAGPMWQTGLIFTNPIDDGGFHDLVWQSAVDAAERGLLTDLPDDDMAIVATVLGSGGHLWQRSLPLGHDWNYIADGGSKDPGVFGRVAHYGGSRAKQYLLDRAPLMFPPTADRRSPWGTVATSAGEQPSLGMFPSILSDIRNRTATTIALPFCLTWHVPRQASQLQVRNACLTGDAPTAPGSATCWVHRDGRLLDRIVIDARPGREIAVRLDGARTVTVVAVGDAPGLSLLLDDIHAYPGDPA